MKLLKRIGCGLLAVLLIGFAVPKVAFASDEYEVYVQAGEGDEINEQYESVETENGGVCVKAEEGAIVTITVVGVVDANGEGVYAEAYDEDTTVTVTTGDVTVDGTIAVNAETFVGTTIEITTGDVTLNGDLGQSEYGSTVGVSVFNIAGDVTVESGDVAVYADPNAEYEWYTPEGVSLYADEGVTTITVGDVYAEGNGIDAMAAYGGENEITTGDVEAAGTAISVSASEGGVLTVNAGDLNAEVGVSAMLDGGYMMMAAAEDKSEEAYEPLPSSITVNVGEINAAEGMYLEAFADGQITVTSEDLNAEGIGIIAIAYDGDIAVTVDGDLTGAEMGGAVIGTWDGSADVLVTGTISGGLGGVGVMEDSNLDTISLTTWAIDLNANGHAVEAVGYNDDDEPVPAYTEEAAAVEQNIQYIVKVEQPVAGAALAALDEDGNPLATSHNYDVARENEKVLLRVNLEAGYRLTGAFNGQGKEQALLQDDAGNYYLLVPKGGGVYLSVEVEAYSEPEPAPEPAPEPEPEPEPVPEPEPEVAPVVAPVVIAAVPAAPEKVLEIMDTTERITLTFYEDCTYTVEMADGSIEEGTYRLNEEDQVVLVNERSEEQPILIEENELPKLVYLFGGNAEEPFEFLFQPEEIVVLREAIEKQK